MTGSYSFYLPRPVIRSGVANNSYTSLALLDTRKHLHISDTPKAGKKSPSPLDEILKARLIAALRKADRDQEARDVSDCGEAFRLFGTNCGTTMAVPFSCNHRLCQRCARIRAGKHYKKLGALLESMLDPKFLTLTVQNVSEINPAYFKWLRGCFSKLRRRKVMAGMLGGVYSIETTFNREARTWHVHIHALIDSKGSIPRDLIIENWKKITGGSWGVDIRRADKRSIYEVLKYQVKVSDFVTEPELISDYLKATKGARLFHSFGSCHNFQVEEDDGKEEKKSLEVAKCQCGNCLRWNLLSTITKGGFYTDESGLCYSWKMLQEIASNTG